MHFRTKFYYQLQSLNLRIVAKNVFHPLQFVKTVSEKLNNMSDAFFGRLVPSEDLTIKTANLVVSLKKVSADDAKGLGMKEGPAKFKLPRNIGNIGVGAINAKVRRIPLVFNISPLDSYHFIFAITVTCGVSTQTALP